MTLPKKKSRLIILVVAVFTVAIFLYLQQTHQQSIESGQDEDMAELRYDAWSNGIRTVRYNIDGERDYVLEARRQVHYVNNISEVELPAIQLFEDARLRWQVSAESGRILGAPDSASGISQLELSDNVIVQYTDASGQDIVMNTEFLTIEADERVMYTNEPVSLEAPGFEQTATGLRANLREDSVDFFSNVQGRYYFTPGNHNGNEDNGNDAN